MTTRYRDLAFDDPAFDFAMHRVIGYAPVGGAAIGECLRAAASIDDGDIVSWSAAWDEVAAGVRAKAEAAATAGRSATARHGYLRAHNYARAAAVWRVHDDPAHLRSWSSSVESFARAAELTRPAIEAIEIPYGSGTLPGWFAPAGADGRARPTLVAVGGGDASGEESWFHCGGDEAARRGYNLVLFHGPGQRGALHRDPSLVWRADYEVVLAAVLDAIVPRSEVDPSRVALYGVSLGGYAVLRAAASDQRIGAVAANSPVLDFHAVAASPPPPPPAGAALPAVSPARIAHHQDLLRWTYGTSGESRDEWLEAIADYRVDHLVERITCPVLSLSSDGEPPSVHPQVQRFAELCLAPLTALHFASADGADAHVQFNNLTLVTDAIYDWLDETLC